MAHQITGIGPLHGHTRLDGQRVEMLVVAFRWQDSTPERIEGYLAKVAGGQANELIWLRPDDVESFDTRHWR
jgi:hypothetical protein